MMLKPLTRRTFLSSSAATLGLAATALLTSCRAGIATTPATAVTKKPVTLLWSTWGNNTNPMVQAASQGAKVFHEQHPNITVHPEPQLAGWPAKIFAQMIAGSGAPDLCGGCCTILPDWARKGVLVTLDSYIARDLKQSQVQDFEQNQYRSFNRPGIGQYALPMYMGTFALYYNKDSFQAAGVAFPTDTWDWNTWQEAMARLTNHQKEQWGVNIQSGNWQIFLNANGGHEVDPHDDLKTLIAAPEALSALQWMHDLLWKSNVAMQAGQAQQGETWYQALLSGRWATALGGSWQLKEGGKQGGADAPLLLSHSWDLAVVPKGPKQRADVVTTDGWVIWKGSKHIEEAWELMQFLETDTWWNINMSITTQQPSRISLQGKWVQTLKKDNPGFQDKRLDAFLPPVKEGYGQVQEIFRYDSEARTVLNNAYTQSVTLNKTSVQEAFTAAAAQIDRIEQQLNSGGTTSSTKK